MTTPNPAAAPEGVADSIIQAVYRTLLGREPDPDGMIVYRDFLGIDPLARLEAFIEVLLFSPEANRRFRDGRVVIQADPGSITIGGRAAARVVGLGSRCTIAQTLQDLGLRSGSYPFDWIFSTPEIVVHCLEDDFELFLRKDQYEPIAVEHRAVKQFNLCDHATFRDAFGQGAMFNHRNPTEADDHAYLVRCVDRFRAMLASSDPTLFVLVTDGHQDPEAAYLRLSRVLEKSCAGGAALLFVVVDNRASTGLLPWVREERQDGDHRLVAFDAVGTLGGTRFDHAVDELAMEALIRTYNIAGIAPPAQTAMIASRTVAGHAT